MAVDTASSPCLGFLRLRQIIGDPKATPPVTPLYPVSRSSWWAGVKAGRYPRPIKLGPRTTAWRATDICSFLESVGSAK